MHRYTSQEADFIIYMETALAVCTSFANTAMLAIILYHCVSWIEASHFALNYCIMNCLISMVFCTSETSTAYDTARENLSDDTLTANDLSSTLDSDQDSIFDMVF